MRDGALSRREAEQFVETAAAAPSTHNLQPWRFVARLPERVIEIYADPTRALRRADPHGRAVHIACGAALFNLRLAIASAGAEPVARLLPSPRNPLLLAAVRVAGPHRPQASEQDLLAAVHAVRAGGSGRARPARAVGPGLIAALAEAAALEGASLTALDRAQALRVLAFVSSDWQPGASAARLGELAEYTPGRGDRHWPPLGPGSHLAVVSTAADDRASWLRAGQALQRVLLLAVHAGVPACPVGQTLEPLTARPQQDPRLGPGYPEVVVRLGPEASAVGRWPGQRRPVGQVMRVAAAQSGRPRAVAGDEGPRSAPPLALPLTARELLSSK